MSLLTKSIIDTVHEAYEVQSRTNLGAVCIIKQSPSHQVTRYLRLLFICHACGEISYM